MKNKLLLLAVLAAPLLVGSCGHKAGPAPGGGDPRAFDKATPEVKQVWERALEADRTNVYVVAQMLLYGLSRQQLPPEQQDAVTRQTSAINKRMYDAAEKGDAAAMDAIRELRRNPPNR